MKTLVSILSFHSSRISFFTSRFDPQLYLNGAVREGAQQLLYWGKKDEVLHHLLQRGGREGEEGAVSLAPML